MMKFLALFLVLTCFSSTVFSYPLNPDEQMTPGELCDYNDGDYQTERYQERIPYCKRNVSSYQKRRIYEEYHIPSKCRSNYTIDHLIPLSIGGNNSDENLWPEHKMVKATRQNLELEIFQAVSAGKMTQKQAVEIILKVKKEEIKNLPSSNRNDDCNRPG